MSLIFNNNEPNNIIYNGNEVNKIIYNGNIVWEKNEDKVHYIEYLDGNNQYLDTTFFPSNNTKIEYEVEMSSSALYRGILGCRNKNNSFCCFTGKLNQDTVWRFDWGGSQFNSWKTIEVGEKIKIIVDKNKMYINEELYHTYPEKQFNQNQSIYIFAVNDNGTPYAPSEMKLYNCKIYENNILVNNFKPCLDSNNIECLYDEVTKKYFYKKEIEV